MHMGPGAECKAKPNGAKLRDANIRQSNVSAAKRITKGAQTVRPRARVFGPSEQASAPSRSMAEVSVMNNRYIPLMWRLSVHSYMTL